MNQELAERLLKKQNRVSQRFFYIVLLVMANYVSLEEIMEIYCLSQQTAWKIIKNYCNDKYKDENRIFVKFSEFHNIYTSKFNPPLFWWNPEANLLAEAFSKPINCREKLKRIRMVKV